MVQSSSSSLLFHIVLRVCSPSNVTNSTCPGDWYMIGRSGGLARTKHMDKQAVRILWKKEQQVECHQAVVADCGLIKGKERFVECIMGLKGHMRSTE
jgi:hypothetical protein